MTYGRTTMFKSIFAVAVLVSVLPYGHAELTPKQGQFDSRVRVVDYNPADVIRINTWYGVSTHVQFADGETIRDVAIGDDQAWTVMPRGNHLFFKPKTTHADTNVTVVTNVRVYQFALIVVPRNMRDPKAWRDANLIYSLSFRYPADEAAKGLSAEVSRLRAETIQLQADAIRKNKEEVSDRLKAAKRRDENRDYWVAGSEEVTPTAARDDGRFIYLTFSNNRDMPAVYEVDASGKEALVNTNVEGNQIVVQRLVKQLTLRKGDSVACVVNRSFDLDGGRDNTSGTVAPDVERVIKGGTP